MGFWLTLTSSTLTSYQKLQGFFLQAAFDDVPKIYSCWEIPWTEEPGRGCKESDTTERLSMQAHTALFYKQPASLPFMLFF